MKREFKPDGCDARDIEQDTVADMADCLDRFFECLDIQRQKSMQAKGREIKKKLERLMRNDPR
jgi:hypothetical protein